MVGGNESASRRSSVPTPAAPDEPPAALTPEERIKRELHPLDAWPRVLHCVHADRPPDADDRFRFRWFGLFYQGPEQDAFLLRLRLPGGRLRAFQLTGLAEITQELAGGCLLCNAQGGLDLPGVPVRAAAEIVRRVEAIGLRSLLTGGDCVQAVRGGEHEGLAVDAPPTTIYPLVCELEQALLHDRQLADLPGGCEVVLGTAGEASTNGMDAGTTPGVIVFQAVPSSAGHPQYTLSVPRVGALDLPLTGAQVVPVCLGLLRRWSEGGGRADRQGAGLAEFCVGAGGGRLREWLAEYAEPTAEVFPENRPAAGVPAATIIGVAAPRRRLLSRTLVQLADLARGQGCGEVRLASGCLHVPRATDPELARKALQEALGDQ